MNSKVKWTLIGIFFVVFIAKSMWDLSQTMTIKRNLNKFKRMELRGTITFMKTNRYDIDFTVDKKDEFTFGKGDSNNEEEFYKLVTVGDSIIKPAGSDTFTLKHQEKYFNFIIEIPE